MKIILIIFFTFSFSNEDQKIIKQILSSFSKRCNYITAIEENIVRKLDENYKQAQQDVAPEVLNCYRERMTEITSTHYIYKNLCQEVTQKKRLGSEEALRIFVGVQKYRNGIRLEHSVLNDCLSLLDQGDKYLVDLNFNRIKVEYLKGRLEEIEPLEDFVSNRENFR